ncbi:MAG TPA: hypothetical protein VL283_05080 [Candidatus Baltobacteraceae bacterium]|nr:hypothetical protein [Candidatus Baltobacteraceae bacterium]
MSGERTPAIPPGIRLSIEASRARFRELGLNEKTIDAMLKEAERRMRAETILREALVHAILLVHGQDGWRFRRRLKKALDDGSEAQLTHLRDCPACGLWLRTLNDIFLDELFADLTA